MGLSLLVGKYVSQMKNVTFSADIKGISYHDIGLTALSASSAVSIPNTSGYTLAYAHMCGYSTETILSSTNTRGYWVKAFTPSMSVLTASYTQMAVGTANYATNASGPVGFKVSKNGCYVYSASTETFARMNNEEFMKRDAQLILIK